MAFVNEESFELPLPPLKERVLQMVQNFMQQNGIETTRKYAKGLYTVDLVQALREEMSPIPDERVTASLKELISQASILVGAKA
ncbi:MAG: hypothetical protein ACREQ5_03655 [Candidatus Dormibacteria bacterium]